MMYLYLDDVRPAPNGWDLARSVEEAWAWVDIHSAIEYVVSLDFDLGMTSGVCPTCNNRGFGYIHDRTHPEYCKDCTHEIVTNDLSAPTGIEFLFRVSDSHRAYPEFMYLPEKIYLHTANPIGRSAMQWTIRDMQREFGRKWPEAFR